MEARSGLARAPVDWAWFERALQTDDKWFVSAVFAKASVPKRLLAPLITAGVRERDPSANRWLIEPCVNSYGSLRVLQELKSIFQAGENRERGGVASASYWTWGNPKNEDVREVWEELNALFLREFINNENVDVRRRILIGLPLTKFPRSLASEVSKAVEIARAHPDEFLRHRVEVQLRDDVGPLRPLPT